MVGCNLEKCVYCVRLTHIHSIFKGFYKFLYYNIRGGRGSDFV